jgi:hypothetical protein
MLSSMTSDRQRRTQWRDLTRRNQLVTGRPKWEAFAAATSQSAAVQVEQLIWPASLRELSVAQ